jgi:hypothetical protein
MLNFKGNHCGFNRSYMYYQGWFPVGVVEQNLDPYLPAFVQVNVSRTPHHPKTWQSESLHA